MKKNLSIRLLLNFLIIIVLVGFDQFTKYIARRDLSSAPKVLINNVLEFYYLENHGAAFGILQGKQIVFFIITCLVMVGIVYIMCKLPFDKKYNKLNFVLTMIFAGGLGNMIDRLTKSSVTDFIYFKIINFPVFNVADIYVTVSVIVFIILLLFVYKDDELTFFDTKDRRNKKDK